MTDERTNVLPTIDVKTNLNAYLKRVRKQGVESEPVYFGAHRKREAVIISAARYEMMQDWIRLSLSELVPSGHQGAETTFDTAEAPPNFRPATVVNRKPFPDPVDLIGGPVGHGRGVVERHLTTEQLQALQPEAREELGDRIYTEAEVRDLIREATKDKVDLKTADEQTLIATLARIENILEDIDIAKIIRKRLQEPGESISLADIAEQLGLDPKEFK